MSEWLIVLAVAIIGVLFLVYQANKEPSFNPPPPKPKADPLSLNYEQLRKFDGVSSPLVYVALKGVIYDVSSSDFYGVGGGYHQFAGHDASINLAKMSHDDQFLDKYGLITLDKEESTVLNDWVVRFEMKYLTVGNVVDAAGVQQ
jgi:membrane-associated progesterone receptor component